MIACIVARALLGILVAPFFILIVAMVYALAASRVGEQIAPIAAVAAAGAMLFGLNWWLGEVGRLFGSRQAQASAEATSRRPRD
jgi:hypothetical protein